MSSAYPHPVTWIVVADAAQAHFYARREVEHLVPLGGHHSRHHEEKLAQELVPVMEMQAEPERSYDIGRQQLGSVHESGGVASHRTEPKLGVHDELRRRFVQRISAELKAAWEKQFFGQLVLVAPPKMLGELRNALDEPVANTIIAELAKDYAKYERQELTERLRNIA